MGFGDAFSAATRNNKGNGSIANIIEFVDSLWGLGGSTFRLFPVQRVILKATYGIELDDTEPIVPVWGDITSKDGWREGWRREEKHMLTEAEYLRYLYETGRCNVAEIIPGRERREMVLSVGRRSGKCITGDSLVPTEKGLFRIDELGDPAGPEVQPLDLGVVQESGRRARSRYFYNAGTHPVIKIRTHCGYKLGGTAKHRIKVMDADGVVRWRYLPDIKLGDQIAINRSAHLWADKNVDARPYHNDEGRKEVVLPDEIDERWGLLLGCLVGDGLWGYEDRTELTVSDPEFIEQARALFTELLGSYTTSWDLRREHTGQIKFSGKRVRRFLHDIGYRLDLTRDTKCVPWSILRSPASVVRAFLRGLFETDGGVEKGGQVVSFSTASPQLAREVQLLLLNLGIVSRVRPKWNKDYQRDYHHLTVRGLRSRSAFAELVGFMTKRKGEPLLASVQSAGREGGDTESIPHQRAWARRLLESVPRANPGQGWSRSTLRAKLGNTIKPGASDEMTYPRLDSALGVASELGADQGILEHFEHLRELDYFYDPVETIDTGEEPVFDLNVPDGEAFVANGMTNHNTFMSACIAAYETYKLISKYNPQAYYGLPETDIIQLISVATDKDQAGILFQGVSGHFNNCSFFEPYLANNTQSYVRFQTPADVDRFGPFSEHGNPNSATIKVTFKSCVAKGLRGSGNICIILDEFAHFTDGTQSSAKTIYEAVRPSLSAFTAKDPSTKQPIDPNEPSEGRMIMISSPLGRQGKFYEQFQRGFMNEADSQNILAIQAPTWEVNPTLSPGEFAGNYAADTVSFFTEYGGEFTDATRGWIRNRDDLIKCIDPDLRPRTSAPPRMPHFMGLDFALGNDATAVAIGHLDADGRIVLDLVERIIAGEGRYEDYDGRLDFDSVADWVYGLCRKFYISEGMFDQWCGVAFEQALAKRGLSQLRKTDFTRPFSSQVFKNFKDMMYEDRLVLYNHPVPEGQEYADYIEELLTLQETVHNKYISTVEAPQIAGAHDDMSDAIVRMVWLASQHAGKVPTFGRRLGGQQQGRRPGQPARGSGAKVFATNNIRGNLKRRLGGTHPSRMPGLLKKRR